MSTKSRPGACDICGCAVVRLTDGDPIVVNEVDCFSGCVTNRNEWGVVKIPDKGIYSVNGHKYENGKLIKVRCAKHTDGYDKSPGLDANGGDGSERLGYCVREIGLG